MTYEDDLSRAWERLGEQEPEQFLLTIRELAESPEVPEAVREFEIACAHDSTGHSDLAVPGYRRALEAGLTGYRARRAVIQLASSLRNLGRSEESVTLLADLTQAEGDGLDDAVAVFRALALTDVGRPREAVVLLVHALADHLPRYTASAHRYADQLLDTPEPEVGRHGEKD